MKNYIYHFYSLLLLSGLLFSVPATVLSQEPTAQYPLFVHKFNRNYLYVNYWDVSGNGKHGNTYHPEANTRPANGGRSGLYYENEGISAEATSTQTKLKQGFFPAENGLPCLKKDADHIAFVDIPEPFSNYYPSLYNQDFTVSFWVYPYQNPTDVMDIFVSKQLVIRINNQANLEVGLLNQSNTELSIFKNDTISISNSWQFINVSYNATNQNFNILQTTNSIENYTSLQYQRYNLANQDTIPIPSIDSSRASILSETFVGEIFNIRFFDTIPADSVFAVQDFNFAQGIYKDANNKIIGGNYIPGHAIAYYPLNGSSFNSWKINEYGNDALSTSGTINATTDRFGRADSALNFSGMGANIKLANTTNDLFSSYLNNYVPYNEPETPDANGQYGNFTNPKGISFSYWVKIEENLSSPTSVNTYQLPFDSTDTRYKIFTGYDNDNGMDVYGMQRIKDRLGIFRVNRIQGKAEDPWFLWCYDPINFTNNQGWYHIILSQYMNWLRIYEFGPDDSLSIESLYMELDTLGEIDNWYLGSNTSDYGPGKFDDFRVYNWPLYESEAIALHEIEKTIWTKSAKLNTTLNNNVIENVEQILKIDVYPNPANEKLYINITLDSKEKVNYSLVNLKGITIKKDSKIFDPGTSNWELSVKNMVKGIYFLQVNTSSLNCTKKVVIN